MNVARMANTFIFSDPSKVHASGIAKGVQEAEKGIEIRRTMRRVEREEIISESANKNESDQNFFQVRQVYSENRTLSNYGETLREARLKTKDTRLAVKRLRYNFKGISSRLMSSKTSASAKRVVGMAKREVARLKRLSKDESYNADEIQSALSHAKNMERIAKKRVRHLEEEEMSARNGGVCAEYLEEQEKKADSLKDTENREELDDLAEDEFYENDEAYEDYENLDMYEGFEEMELYADFGTEMIDELTEELNEEMNALLEEMGLGDLEEALMPAGKDMDPEDLKMMKIKHRSKELKDIAEADKAYLDEIFKQQQSGLVPSVDLAI